MRLARHAFRWMAWLFVACVVVQFFLAGLGVFAGEQNFATHRDWGYTFGWLLLLLIAAALVGRIPGRAIAATALLLVLFALQSVLVALRDSMPGVAALHPLNGVAIFTIALWLAQRAAGWVAAGTPSGATVQSEAAR